MTKVIFVHGMNADGESWLTLPDLLGAKGHDVVAPLTLPGHDKRLRIWDLLLSGKYTSGLSMDDYVDAVASTFPSGGGRDVALVGHSLGGAVISHVAAKHPDRIAGLIYVAAMLPDTGQSANTLISASQAAGSGGASFLGDFLPHIGQIRLVKQPEEPLDDVFNRSPAFDALPKSYIICEDDDVIPAKVQRDMLGSYAAAATVPETASLNRSHLPQFDNPEELAAQCSAMLPP